MALVADAHYGDVLRVQARQLGVLENIQLCELGRYAVSSEFRAHLFDDVPSVVAEVTAGLPNESDANWFHAASLGRTAGHRLRTSFQGARVGRTTFASLGDMRRPVPLSVTAAALMLLTGCGAAAGAGGTPTADATSPADPSPSDSAHPQFSIAQVSSCAEVEAAVQPYIEGLVPNEANVVDEWGVSCSWETADGELDPANIRAVSVQLAPVEPDAEAPDPSLVAQSDGGTVIDSDWVSAHGGVAFSLTLGTAVAGATATTVWVPGVEATVGGGTWDGYPALDGPAAVDLVRGLISEG